MFPHRHALHINECIFVPAKCYCISITTHTVCTYLFYDGGIYLFYSILFYSLELKE